MVPLDAYPPSFAKPKPMILRATLCLSFLTALGACASQPEVSARESAGVALAPYPELLPTSALPQTEPAQESASAKAERDLAARAARLKARAASLRKSEI